MNHTNQKLSQKTSKNRQDLLNEYFECMHLLRRVFHKASPHATQSTTMTRTQISVLWLFAKKQVMTTKEIAECFHMSSSAATQLIDKLVKEKLRIRKTDDSDRRQITLSMSAKGKKMLITMKKERHGNMKKIFDALSDKELQTFVGLQKKIIHYWENTENI
jgi:DNA-binding MarR family transcriptional regulator